MVKYNKSMGLVFTLLVMGTQALQMNDKQQMNSEELLDLADTNDQFAEEGEYFDAQLLQTQSTIDQFHAVGEASPEKDEYIWNNYL